MTKIYKSGFLLWDRICPFCESVRNINTIKKCDVMFKAQHFHLYPVKCKGTYVTRFRHVGLFFAALLMLNKRGGMCRFDNHAMDYLIHLVYRDLMGNVRFLLCRSQRATRIQWIGSPWFTSTPRRVTFNYNIRHN